MRTHVQAYTSTLINMCILVNAIFLNSKPSIYLFLSRSVPISWNNSGLFPNPAFRALGKNISGSFEFNGFPRDYNWNCCAAKKGAILRFSVISRTYLNLTDKYSFPCMTVRYNFNSLVPYKLQNCINNLMSIYNTKGRTIF